MNVNFVLSKVYFCLSGFLPIGIYAYHPYSASLLLPISSDSLFVPCSLVHPSLIIDSYLGDWSGRPPRPKQRVGSERPWHKESHDMPDSVRGGLWRPGGAFFQIGLGCVMSHHHIDGLCTFQFKFWRENSKWSSCQQSVA